MTRAPRCCWSPAQIAPLLLALLGATHAWAAGPTPAADAPAAAAATPEAPPPPSAPSLALGTRLDRIAANLVAVQEPTTPPVDVSATTAQVAELDAEVRARIELLDPAAATTLSPGVLDSLATSLDRIGGTATRTRTELTAAVEQLEARRATLKGDAEFLKAVLAAAGRAELPPTLFERSRDALTVIATTREALRSQLDGLVALDGRLRDLQTAVTTEADTLRDRRQSRREAVFVRDQPAVWTVLDETTTPANVARNVFAATRIALVEYVRENPGAWAGLGTLLLVLLAVTFGLRRATLTGGGYDSAQLASDPIVQRPVAITFLVWDVLGPGLFALDPPIAIGFLRVVLGAIAVQRLLPLLTSAPARRLLSAILLLAVVGTAILLAGTASVSARIALLVLGVVGAAITHRLAGTLRGADTRIESVWGRLLDVVTRITPYVLLAGTIAGSLGAMSLAEQLINGGLIGTVVPLLLAATDRVLRTVFDRAIDRAPLRWLRAVRRYPDAVRQRAFQAIDLALLLVALQIFVRLFPFLRPAYAAVVTALGTRLTVGGLNVSLLDVLTLGVGIALAVLAARLVRFLLEEDVFPRTAMTAGASAAASRLLYYALVGIGSFMAIAASGFDLSQLTLLVSALGVGIGFGLQNIVSNFVSGIVLAFERPIQPGDLVAVGTMTGRVREIGLRATTVSTFEGADVIVPNSQFISGEVVNWTLADRSRRIEIAVGVAYGTDLHRVQQLLREVVLANPGIVASPEPMVVFRRFGESAIDFSVLFWAPDTDQVMTLTSEVGIAIWEALAREGISIPFPQREVQWRSAPDAAKPPPVSATPRPAAPRIAGSPPEGAAPPADPE